MGACCRLFSSLLFWLPPTPAVSATRTANRVRNKSDRLASVARRDANVAVASAAAAKRKATTAARFEASAAAERALETTHMRPGLIMKARMAGCAAYAVTLAASGGDKVAAAAAAADAVAAVAAGRPLALAGPPAVARVPPRASVPVVVTKPVVACRGDTTAARVAKAADCEAASARADVAFAVWRAQEAVQKPGVKRVEAHMLAVAPAPVAALPRRVFPLALPPPPVRLLLTWTPTIVEALPEPPLVYAGCATAVAAGRLHRRRVASARAAAGADAADAASLWRLVEGVTVDNDIEEAGSILEAVAAMFAAAEDDTAETDLFTSFRALFARANLAAAIVDACASVRRRQSAGAVACVLVVTALALARVPVRRRVGVAAAVTPPAWPPPRSSSSPAMKPPPTRTRRPMWPPTLTRHPSLRPTRTSGRPGLPRRLLVPPLSRSPLFSVR